MSTAGDPDRESRARAILEEEGIRAEIRSRGTAGEIAAVAAPGTALGVLERIAPRLRRLGYRYVALDLSVGHGTEE